jgi:hypothetical protein
MLQNKSNQQIALIATKHSHIFTVQLNLGFQTRYIGKIDTAGEGTFIISRSEKHLFRKTNSLGINYSLLTDESIRFKDILITYKGKKLYSTRNYFLKKGKAFQFSNKGFELQIFVPLDELNLQTVKRFEQTFLIQENLFGNVA